MLLFLRVQTGYRIAGRKEILAPTYAPPSHTLDRDPTNSSHKTRRTKLGRECEGSSSVPLNPLLGGKLASRNSGTRTVASLLPWNHTNKRYRTVAATAAQHRAQVPFRLRRLRGIKHHQGKGKKPGKTETRAKANFGSSAPRCASMVLTGTQLSPRVKFHSKQSKGKN